LETGRINAAGQLGLPEYQRLNLAAEFQEALAVMRHCLQIRNQYAHWVWWDDYSGKLAFANVEDLVNHPGKVTDFTNLNAHHVDVTLLKAQEAYFVYADDLLLWVNYEGRFKDGKIGKARQNLMGPKPASVKQPSLYL
jgi:hypothetical protein